jgi:hypothetical protein
VLAGETPYVLSRLLELLTIACVAQITRDHNRCGLIFVYLLDRTLQKLWDEVDTPTVDVADLADG